MNTLQTQNNNINILNVGFENLTDFANHYRNEMIYGKVLNKNKKRISAETIKTYKTVIDHIIAFENILGVRLKCSELNKKLFQQFEQYLISKSYSQNSISLYVSKLKAIKEEISDREIAYLPSFRFSTPKEKTTKIYLTISELAKMNDYKMTDYERRYMDFFLIGCFTGLRFQTLVKFTMNPTAYIKEYNGFNYIDITSDKTNDGQSIIPIGKTVFDILNRNNSCFPQIYIQDANQVIKKIAEGAELNSNIVIRKTEGGITREIIVPKFNQVTTHTARRTFITLLKPLLNNDDVLMGMTSHRSKQQLNDYNRSSNLEKVLPAFGNEFFNLTF
ncbi:tyrosine-type recombinase/integrase [Chryseobacterium sp. DT-3]|uniref:tyrosine-type recombinase/integrase n=1 Tax=Chryseobacterium sp. DT-3 TaxID=3396164 RepID=UPI003F1A32BC